MANSRVQHSIGTKDDWVKYDPSLRLGEIIVEQRSTGKIALKVGSNVSGEKYSVAPYVWDQESVDKLLSDLTTTATNMVNNASASQTAAKLSETNASTYATNAAASATDAKSAAQIVGSKKIWLSLDDTDGGLNILVEE